MAQADVYRFYESYGSDGAYSVTFGPQIMVDPGFDNAPSWTTSGNWAVSGGKANLVAAVGNDDILQNPTYNHPSTYEIRIIVDSITGTIVPICAGVNLPAITTTGLKIFLFDTSIALSRFSIRAVVGTSCVLDCFEAREVI